MDNNITRAPIMGPGIPTNIFNIESGASSPGFSYLTPDALLAYCQTKLQSTDSQMETYFNSEQQNATGQQALTTLEAAINRCVSKGLDTGQAHAGMDLITACENAIHDAGPNSPAGQQITQLRDQMANTLDPTGHLSQALQTNAADVMAKYQGYIAADPSGHDANFIQTLGGPVNGVPLGTTDVQAWLTQAQGIGSSLGNDSQMGMIQLQSLMSERQTSIQMCTNLVQSLGDQASKITANIGH